MCYRNILYNKSVQAFWKNKNDTVGAARVNVLIIQEIKSRNTSVYQQKLLHLSTVPVKKWNSQ